MLAAGVPFSSSAPGAVALVLIGALAMFVFTYVPAKFRQSRDRDDRQLVLLTQLTDAVNPSGRPGLVQRVEELERNLDGCSRELERHIALSETQRREILESVAAMTRDIERMKDATRQNVLPYPGTHHRDAN